MNKYLLILALLATPALHAAELDHVNCHPPAAEAVPDAGAIAQLGWPSARLQAAGREAFTKYQCVTAQAYLRAALDGAAPGTDPAVVAAALHDLMRIALVTNDRATIDALGPRLLAAWDRSGVPNAEQGAIIYVQLFRLNIGREAYVDAENDARRCLALMKLAPRFEAGVRLATYDLARALYGQLRYADAEAAIAPYTPTLPDPASPYYERLRTRDDMIALVRDGKLKEALALGEPALATYEADVKRAQQAWEHAETTLAEAKAEAIPAQSAAADTALRRARGSLFNARVNAAQAMGELGEIHHAMNQLTRAEVMYNAALELYQKALPRFPTQVAMVQSALGTLYISSDRPELALPLLRNAQEIYLVAGGTQHPDVLETAAEIARAEAALAVRGKPSTEPSGGPARARNKPDPTVPGYAYGVVQRLEKQTYFGCTNQQKQLCYDAAPEAYLFAFVHIHTNTYKARVVVPNGAVHAGDIVKFQHSLPGSKDARFIEMGATKAERNPNTCDWIDGDQTKFTGGVSCRGWIYSSEKSFVNKK